jgi:hypothetical protein
MFYIISDSKLSKTLKSVTLASKIAAPLTIIGFGVVKLLDEMYKKNICILNTDEDIKKFDFAYGNSPRENTVYVRHPKVSAGNILIPAERYREYILREQAADIVDYIASAVPVRSIELSVLRSTGGKLSLTGIVENLPVKSDGNISLENSYSVKIQYEKPLVRPAKPRMGHWMSEYDHIVRTIAPLKGGTVSVRERSALNMGFSVKMAEMLGIKSTLQGDFEFELNVVVG